MYDSRLNGRYAKALWQAGAPFRVDFVLGAALMARAELLRQVGGLDDGFFMYCEEMDLCLRAADAGWGVFAVPAAQVVHLAGQSSRQTRWHSFERLWRSRLRFYGLHRAHFAAGTEPLVRLLVRCAMVIGARRVFTRFAQGNADGVAAGAEIAARQAIRRSAQSAKIA